MVLLLHVGYLLLEFCDVLLQGLLKGPALLFESDGCVVL